ncbi:hypothetical protein [Streptomyces sp. NPDC085466]|uniref:hypothetical protein n=1 Tax=Streptomyces sp. NPDC085466 TaxID=3365725 RepID=UPI0037D6C88F
MLDVFDHLPHGHPLAGAMLRRELLSRTFSWTIAAPSTLRWIVRCASGAGLLEVGAGTGYWAARLRQAGADIVATDAHGVEHNGFAGGFQHAQTVVCSAVDAVRRYPGRTLMILWPPKDDPMAAQALRAYQGDSFLYVGEGPGGMCADTAFFAELERGWLPAAIAPLTVRWLGHRDRPTLYRRRPRAVRTSRRP